MEKKRSKYFLLYLKTGGGHLAPANAVAEYLRKKYPDKIDVQLVDAFEEANPTIKYAIEEGYRKLQKSAKWFYEFLYALYHVPFVTNLNDLVLSNSIVPYLEKRILQEKPDSLILFHFFLITPVYKIIKRHRLQTKIITIVTDPYTAHPFWFKKKGQEYIIFSHRLEKNLLKKGIPEDKLHVFPFLLNEKFGNPFNANEVFEYKKKHGFRTDKKAVLIFGGGDGIPKGEKILHKLLNNKIEADIAIVCGKNGSLFKRAQQIKEEYKADNLLIFGYVNFIYELINISDVVITKAGASAAMEILSLKKIPVIIDYLWGQEKGNVEFIVNNKMGLFERDIEKLPKIIKDLLQNEDYYKEFQSNIISSCIKIGTPEVSEYLITHFE